MADDSRTSANWLGHRPGVSSSGISDYGGYGAAAGHDLGGFKDAGHAYKAGQRISLPSQRNFDKNRWVNPTALQTDFVEGRHGHRENDLCIHSP